MYGKVRFARRLLQNLRKIVLLDEVCHRGKTFEVGGRKKGKKQILAAEDGYVVADDIEYSFQNKIPLWMFGFVY